MSKPITRQSQDAYLVAATRTPVAKRNGMFGTVRPDDLLAHVLHAGVAQLPQLDPRAIGDVYVGCAIPEAEQGMNMARLGVLMAGLPDSVPAITINRFCSSGLNAVAMAADRIRLGEAEVAIGAGAESMSVMPQMFGKGLYPNPRWMKDEHVALAYGMGLTAERVAEHFRGVCRGAVERHDVPNLLALNFILHDSLGGGGTESLITDAQGKTHAQGLLAMLVEVPEELL